MSSSCAGYITLITTLLGAIKEETLLKVTENGPPVTELISHLQKSMGTRQARDFFIGVVSRLEGCLRAGNRCRLPSAKAGRVWTAFHRLRNESSLRAGWTSFLQSICLPAVLRTYSAFAFQLILDRLLKRLICLKKEELTQTVDKHSQLVLTLREQNVVYYMSGYIPVNLIKRFKKKSPVERVQQKRRMFLRVLREMRADNQQDDINSPEDYTRLWSEQIDRGGLYQIKPEVIIVCLDGRIM